MKNSKKFLIIFGAAVVLTLILLLFLGRKKTAPTPEDFRAAMAGIGLAVTDITQDSEYDYVELVLDAGSDDGYYEYVVTDSIDTARSLFTGNVQTCKDSATLFNYKKEKGGVNSGSFIIGGSNAYSFVAYIDNVMLLSGGMPDYLEDAEFIYKSLGFQ